MAVCGVGSRPALPGRLSRRTQHGHRGCRRVPLGGRATLADESGMARWQPRRRPLVLAPDLHQCGPGVVARDRPAGSAVSAGAGGGLFPFCRRGWHAPLVASGDSRRRADRRGVGLGSRQRAEQPGTPRLLGKRPIAGLARDRLAKRAVAHPARSAERLRRESLISD